MKIDNRWIEDAPANTILGNNTQNSESPSFLTISEVRTMLGINGGDMFLPSEIIAYGDGAPSYIQSGIEIESQTLLTTASGFNSAVGTVTSISDPAGTGGWSDIVSISGGPLVAQFYCSTFISNMPVIASMHIDGSDSAYFRMQILIDDVAVYDATEYVAGKSFYAMLFADATNSTSYAMTCPLYCSSSMKIRCAQQGTISGDATRLRIAQMVYMKGSIA